MRLASWWRCKLRHQKQLIGYLPFLFNWIVSANLFQSRRVAEFNSEWRYFVELRAFVDWWWDCVASLLVSGCLFSATRQVCAIFAVNNLRRVYEGRVFWALNLWKISATVFFNIYRVSYVLTASLKVLTAFLSVISESSLVSSSQQFTTRQLLELENRCSKIDSATYLPLLCEAFCLNVAEHCISVFLMML